MSMTVFHDLAGQENVKLAPMSFTQEGLWFLDQLVPGSALYSIPVAIRRRGLIDVEVLQESLTMLVQRHEVLRTTFGMMEGQLIQVIAPSLTIPLSVRDLRGMTQAEQKAQAQHLATEQAQQPFLLSQGPLLRCTLLHLANEQSLLLLTLHRIICDDWSVEVLVRDLACLYEACISSQPSPLLPLPCQYANFARGQHEGLTEETLGEHLTYWKQQLAGAPAALQLPTDCPRPAVATLRGSTYQAPLPRTLTQALQELSRQQGVSLDMSLVAAFQTLLYRYTGQENLLIGTVDPARRRTETEMLIGACENILLLRTDLSGHPSFAELLLRVREVMEAAQAHEELPFESLVKALYPTRSLGLSSLFQVLVRLPRQELTLLPGWTLEQTAADTETSQFDLTLDLREGPQGLISRFTYSTDLFEETTIARMAGHWQRLLEGIVADPAEPIGKLPFLTEKERHQVLVEWNATKSEFPDRVCLHQLIEAQVERTPDTMALRFEGQSRTYRQLNSEANQLAHILQAEGVGPDTLVGVCMERSLEMVMALLAILKAGGAYVPIDPTYPRERLNYMIEDSCTSVLLTQSHLREQLPQDSVKVICIDRGWNANLTGNEKNPASAVQPDNLIYMIYTSGSTGKPKGVMNIHRAVCNRLHWMQQAYQLSSEDRVLQKTPFSFDVSAWEFFWPLLTGAGLVVARPGGHQDPAYLASVIASEQITTLHFVPSMLQAFLIEPNLEEQCASLKHVFLSGEALSFELQERFFACFPDPKVQLHNLYGPTEAAIDVTFWECQRESFQWSVPIGHPIANTQIFILNPAMQPTPIGVPGELYIGGVGLARGYHHLPELTAEKFIHDPFSTLESARLFKTGDLARYRADGAIEFLGRLDHQVKIRGFRIELGEIEAVLSQHPAVREAVVMAREDVLGEKRLVAYVVQYEEQRATVNELKSQLMKQLPASMVPSAFVQLERLPVTANGKLDRRALPVPELSRTETEESYVAPVLPVHWQLVQIWEELLGVRPIGIKDDFFELGGDSIQALRLFHRMAQVYGKRLSLSTLFAGATIEDVAKTLQEKTKMESRAPLITVQAGGSKRPFFFLHGQWEGGALYSLELARYLGPEQPFYLLEPYTFDGLAVPPTLEEMAAAHLEVLRGVQPEGPYLLGGWCNGGLIAYEMARQLHAQGQTVDLLVLMDADAPAPRFKWDRRIIVGLSRLLRLRQEKHVDVFLFYRHLRLSFHYWRLGKFKRTRIAKQDEPALEPDTLDAVAPPFDTLIPRSEVLRQDWRSIYDWQAAGYMPHSYPGKITFFWTEEEPKRQERWRQLIEEKEVDIHIIPGNHMTSRTTYLPVLAECLRTCLRKTQASWRD